jgi:hypothetical protein
VTDGSGRRDAVQNRSIKRRKQISKGKYRLAEECRKISSPFNMLIIKNDILTSQWLTGADEFIWDRKIPLIEQDA